jgi:hypothetical protein
MNDSSAPDKTLPDDPPDRGAVKPHQFPCSVGHQLLAVVGATFLLFEIVFIDLYSDNFWFSLNIQWLGVPTVLIIALLAHLLLLSLESRMACRWLRFIWQGRPPIVYRRWLAVDDTGITFGLRHLKWDAIDELTLTWLGNLQIKSRLLCGDGSDTPDIVLKLPFGVASQSDQSRVVDYIRNKNPGVIINQRLIKRLSSPVVKGQNFIQLAGGLMMSVVLLDVAHSSFHWLEMLKHYHLAHKTALAATADALKIAAGELQRADDLRAHPLPISYASSQFFSKGISAAGVLQTRSDALMSLNRPQEAIADSLSAVELRPKEFRGYLHLARLLHVNKNEDLARAKLKQAISEQENSLLPRLYLIASLHGQDPQRADSVYKETLKDLDESTFEGEPVWPPGGNRYVTALFYKPDFLFVFDRLLNSRAKTEARPDTEAAVGSKAP